MNFSNRHLSLSKRLQYSVGKGKSVKSYLLLFITLGLATYSIFINVGRDANGADSAVLGANTQIVSSTYVVNKGETIFSIAEKLEMDWKILASLNDLRAPYTVTPTQELIVEKPR